MKGSKSKGKTATNARPPPARAPPKRSLPKRRGRGKTKVPLRKAAEVSLTYLRCKVVFVLNELDPVLARRIIIEFNLSRHKLNQYSILHQLKLRRHKRIQMTYKHTIKASQTLALWDHLKKRQKGKIDEMQQLKELVDLIESYRFEGKSRKPRLEAKRTKLSQKIEHMRRKVKGCYVQIRESLKANFQTSEDFKKAQQLENQIRSKGLELLDLMIIAIREISEDRVQIIFEQSYPEKTCSRAFLYEILGKKIYIAKKINFVKYYRRARLYQKLNNNFISCHICKEPIMENYLRCRNTVYQTFTPSTQNSPNLFQRHLLAFDYCYHAITDPNEQQLSREMDYFKYYPSEHLNLNCNRFLCGNCSEKCVIIENMKDIFAYTCAFCLGMCSCRSCEIAQELVQILAQYKNILEHNFQPLDKYYQLVYFVNLDDDKDVQVNKRNRYTFQADPKKGYQSYYFSLIDDFIKINKTMIKIQDEAVQSLSIYNDVKMMISQYMAQVRKYMFSLRRTQKQISEPDTGKTLSIVRKQGKQYQKQRKQIKKSFQVYESEEVQDEGQEGKKFEGRQAKLKNKLKKCIDMTSITNRCEIPMQIYKITDEEWFLTLEERQQIKKQLVTKLTPVNPATLSKSFFMKLEIPFKKIDYELAANVREECKIQQETQLLIKRAISSHIMYEQNDPCYGYRGCDTTRFHSNQDEFCDILDNSFESDDEGHLEGVSSPVQLGSISPATFLNKHQVELEGETEQDYEQGYMVEDDDSYLNAASSGLFPDNAQQYQINQTKNMQEFQRQQSFEGAVTKRMRNPKKGNKK